MTTLALIIGASVLTVGAGACADEDRTLTGGASSSTNAPSPTDASGGWATTTVDDTEYGSMVDQTLEAITRAGTDICYLGDTGVEYLPEPGAGTQTEQFVQTHTAWMMAVAAALPPNSEDQRQALSAAAAALRARAEAAGYPAGFWDSEDASSVLTDEEYLAGLRRYEELHTAQCPDIMTTTIPIG